MTNPAPVFSCAYTAGAIDSMKMHNGAAPDARSSRGIIEIMIILVSLKGCRSREEAITFDGPVRHR
jgi:hypothetical protein